MRSACLMYHQIADAANPGKFWVRPVDFARQMNHLVARGFKSIDLRHENPFTTPHGVLITFDDGHVSNLAAAKVLAEKGLVGVFYILKDKSLNDPDYLNESQLKEIAAMGHILGIHGKDHKWWPSKSDQSLVIGFDETQKWLQNLTGESVVTCSAPGGILDAHTCHILTRNFPGLKYIRNSRPWYNTGHKIVINSVAMGMKTTLDELDRVLDMDWRYYWSNRFLYETKNVIKAGLRVLGR